MNTSANVSRRIARQLDLVKDRLRRPDSTAAVTIVCVVRHGYATTRVNIESVYATARMDVVMLYVDVNSPPAARQYLAEQARERRNFHYIRVDEYVSRQTARRLVLDLVQTPYTVFMDNNMLFADGWLEHLVDTAREPAEIVSPFIVMRGGRVHFSGSTLTQGPGGTIQRRQNIDECPLASRFEDARPRKMEIDFGESHCCLLTTSGFQPRIDEVFPEDMHNAHTLGLATYLLKTRHGQRMVIEPKAVASILPVGCGYDIPWIFESYLDIECLRKAYELYGRLIGKGVSATLENLWWHRKHLLYLLLSMTEGDRLERSTLLDPAEVSEYVEGYDRPLADDAIDVLKRTVVPYVRAVHPQYSPHLSWWLSDAIDRGVNLDETIDALKGA